MGTILDSGKVVRFVYEKDGVYSNRLVKVEKVTRTGMSIIGTGNRPVIITGWDYLALPKPGYRSFTYDRVSDLQAVPLEEVNLLG